MVGDEPVAGGAAWGAAAGTTAMKVVGLPRWATITLWLALPTRVISTPAASATPAARMTRAARLPPTWLMALRTGSGKPSQVGLTSTLVTSPRRIIALLLELDGAR